MLVKIVMVEVSLVSNLYFKVRGHPYKTSVRFSNFWHLPLSAGVRIEIEPTPPPRRLVSTSIRQNLYCVVNILRDSGHSISTFWMNEKFANLKIINYSIYLYFLELWSHRDRAIKYLNFETNVNVHSCLIPIQSPPHVRMCPLLLEPLLPILRTSFMDYKILFKLRSWQKTDHW